MLLRESAGNLAEAAIRDGSPMALPGSRSDWVKFFVVLGKRIDRHDLTGLSARISYYFSLSLFPFLILLGAIIGLLPFTHLWDDSLQRIVQYFPQDIQGVLWDTVGSLVQAHTKYLSIGLVGTLWAASGALMSLMSALNTVYEVQETRGYLKRLGITGLMVLVLIFLIVASFGLLNAGSVLDQRVVWGTAPPLLLKVLAHLARWAISVTATLVSIRLLDYVLPDLKRPWRWVKPGSIVAAVGWLLGPLGFNFYVRNIASYNRTYGVLGAFVILMVWFYVSSLIILVGAEINSELHAAAMSTQKPEFVTAPGAAPLGEVVPVKMPQREQGAR
jgi:membrane protein